MRLNPIRKISYDSLDIAYILLENNDSKNPPRKPIDIIPMPHPIVPAPYNNDFFPY